MTDPGVDPDEGVPSTSTTLLVRVKNRDDEAWGRFVRLYGPLVYGWSRRFGLNEADAADVGQEVFRTAALSISEVHFDQAGDTVRGWLHSVTRARALDFLRKKSRVADVVGGSDALARLQEIPEIVDDSSVTDEDDRLVLVRRAMEMVLESCKDETRQAFMRVVIEGERPVDVAADLGISANAVYLAKSHVLRKIREEFAQLVDL